MLHVLNNDSAAALSSKTAGLNLTSTLCSITGVGISGQKGMQAVISSDFSIAQLLEMLSVGSTGNAVSHSSTTAGLKLMHFP